MSRVPARLGRYQIIRHLANGGMAQVLIARAAGIEGFERHVVVKRIHAERAEDPMFVKMFLEEARLAASLHHHNIVQVYDIGKDDGEYFFAMEYVHGEDLRKLLTTLNRRKEKTPLAQVVAIMTQAAAALHHAHEHCGPDRKPLGLVHRDVSPANILVGYDGSVKVVDFGIAKAALSPGRENTRGGELKGKVAYMAPEQCAGHPVDRRSDVFALGVVLYELVTVRRLFKAETDFLTMNAIVTGKVPLPSLHRPDLPKPLQDIVFKALAVSPDERYATAEDMREALEQFAAEAGLRTSTGALAAYMKQTFGQRPEPWLDTDELEFELSIDFDGPAPSGELRTEVLGKIPLEELRRRHVGAPAADQGTAGSSDASGARPSAKLPRASTNVPPPVPSGVRKTPVAGVSIVPVERKTPVGGVAIASVSGIVPGSGGTDPHARPSPPGPFPNEPSASWGSRPATGSGTPLAWTPVATTASGPPERRRRRVVVGAAASVALAVVLIAVFAGGRDRTTTSPARAPQPQPQTDEPSQPTANEATQPTESESAQLPTEAPDAGVATIESDRGSAEAPTADAPQTASARTETTGASPGSPTENKAKKKRNKDPTTKPKWDPRTQLFPK